MLTASGLDDGAANAPAGTPQLPGLLNGYAAPPPWVVAGVNYHVGVPSGTALKDPTIQANVPAGVTVDAANHVIRINADNVTLDGYDFSLHGGWGIYCPSASGLTVKNCNFQYGSNPVMPINFGGNNLTVMNCNFGGSSSDQGMAIFYRGGGSFVSKYNYFFNQGSDAIDMGGNPPGFTPTIEYNLFYAIGIAAGAHNDPFQFTGNNNVSSGLIAFNTIYQPQTLKTANYQLVVASEGGSNIANLTVANNTVINTGPNATASYTFAIGLSDGQSLTNTTYEYNYFDPTGAAYGVWFTPQSWGTNTTITSNINMKTGAVSVPSVGSGTGWHSGETVPNTSFSVAITSFSTDSGTVGDHITNDNTLTLTGTAPANSTVKVYDGTTLLSSVTANANGDWSYTTAALANGPHSFTATATSSGTTSAPSSSLSVTMDTVAPAAPVITTETINGNNSVTLAGTAEGNSAVRVFDGATQIGTTTANGGGAWSYTTSILTSGAHILTATATDTAGNASVTSQPVNPVIDGASGTTTNLVVNGDFETGDFTGWALSGNVAPGSYGPQTYINSIAESGQYAAGLGPMGSDGTLSQAIQSAAGQHYTLSFWLANAGGAPNDFTAKWNGQTLVALVNQSTQGYKEYTFDVVGIAGTSNLEFDFQHDPSHWNLDNISVMAVGAQAPAAPVINTFSTDSNVVGDGITNDNTLRLTGTAAADSTIKVYDGTTQIGSTTATSSGSWSYTTGPLADGKHSLIATATSSGTTSAPSSSLSVTMDTVAPAAPVITTETINANNSVTVAGTAEGNSTVRVFDGATQIGTTTANGGGTWSYTTSILTSGAHILTATATDTAGNASVTSQPVDPVIANSGGGGTPMTSLFSASNTPAGTNYDDGTPLEVGVKFQSSVAGQITALKFYRSPSDTGTDLLDLWTATGTKLASATFTNTAASGWQTVALSTPVAIAANTTYVVSYHTTGAYVETDNFFTTDFTSGVLTAPSIGGNGVYAYGGTSTTGIFPTNTWHAANYWADVVFGSNIGTTVTPAEITVSGNGVSITDNDATPSTSDGTDFGSVTQNSAAVVRTFTVRNDGGSTLTLGTPTLPAGFSLVASDPLVSSLAPGASDTFQVQMSMTSTGTKSGQISFSNNDSNESPFNFSITGAVNSGGGGTPMRSLFSASNTPAGTNYDDGTPLEVGVKFQSSVAGQITALKFYRSPSDTGTDLLDLWTATGTKLASATFTNTAASGWQTVALSTPVAIAANTTYVVSYHTTGAYVETDNFFTTDFTSGVLTAPSIGGNGVYAYGGTSTTGIFPTNTWHAANYWADVVFASNIAPAGVAGEAIHLGLTNPTDYLGSITANVSGVPSGWTMSAGTDIGDGTWTVQTNDIGALSVISPESYTGALVLNVSESWVNANGSSGNAFMADNVEVYAKGTPIFAVSGDDNLSGSSGDDLFVVAQPIGNDTIHSFDVAHDKVDLIGFCDLSSFVDVQTRLSENSNGDAVVTIAEGESITFDGVSAASLTEKNFVFNRDTVMDNANSIVIGDNALLPLGGNVNNGGTVELTSIGGQTRLQVLANGLTLEGGGHVDFSDNNGNIIVGTTPDATLTNVDNTISGAGQLGEGQLRLHNEGNIIASGGNALTIDTGANVVVNAGTLEAIGSGGLVVHSDIANSGLLWANGGDITIDGNVSGTGAALIDGVATFEVGGAFGENVTLDSGASATLKMDHAANFSGTVAGFDADDALDLVDVAFGSNTTLGYAANSSNTGGTLTVSDGTHTANIALLGQYMAGSFVMSANGFGGTLVHDLPPATLTHTLTQPQHA